MSPRCGAKPEFWNSFMQDLIPFHAQGNAAATRGILDGWYAISTAGAVCSGLFLTEADCDRHIEQERVDINAYHQGAANHH